MIRSKLTVDGSVTVRLVADESLNVNLAADAPLKVKLDGGFPHESYGGPYIVEPSAEGLTLWTADLVMKENVVIGAITFTETENEFGGVTVRIGGTQNG